VQPGDLVRSVKFKSIGIITEIFDDLDKENPWVRVLFTHPTRTYQWCKKSGLTKLAKEDLPSSHSGSLGIPP